MRRSRLLSVGLAFVMTIVLTPFSHVTRAIPNPVATNDAEYAAFGRVFSDPHGCRVTDVDGDGTADVVPPATSPWAKGNMCFAQYITYQEAMSQFSASPIRIADSLFTRWASRLRSTAGIDSSSCRSHGRTWCALTSAIPYQLMTAATRKSGS